MNKRSNLPRQEKPRVVLLIDTSREYGRSLLRGIANYCKLHGLWDIHLEQPVLISKIGDLLDSWNADALITDIPYAQHVEKLGNLNVPVIATMAPSEIVKSLCYIDADNLRTGVIAAEYFLQKNFQSFAYSGYKNMTWSKKRGLGFSQALMEKELSVSIFEQSRNRIQKNWQEELSKMIDWIQSLSKPVAILACNDEHAQHIIEACQKAEIKIPEEVAILGIDNDEVVCDLFNPPLSSIALNVERAGYESAELLTKIIKGQSTNSNIIIVEPQYVIERQSTDVLQIQDEDVVAALRYIRENSNRILQINEVLDFVAVSKRSLQLKFNRIVGHSISEEIRRNHSRYIARLLVETNRPILEIARSMGYTSEHNISRYFRKMTGHTPKKFRRLYGQK